MLRIGNLRNKYQKRLIRPLYAQTQATPYAAELDASLRNADGSYNLPAGAFKYKNGLVPGSVVMALGEKVIPATGADVTTNHTAASVSVPDQPLQAFGLLANFVGGDLDDLGDNNFVGVWRGPDAVFEILAPGFDDTGLSAAWSAATAGVPVPLYAGTDGRLKYLSAPGNRQVVAFLIERPNANRIVIDLKV